MLRSNLPKLAVSALRQGPQPLVDRVTLLFAAYTLVAIPAIVFGPLSDATGSRSNQSRAVPGL
ncbi:MAG: hypothetical protein JOZ07_14070 [Solirubrobacterales bacterium]|nr:hypothetical protein [Solirubrobacterales bacterium]